MKIEVISVMCWPNVEFVEVINTHLLFIDTVENLAFFVNIKIKLNTFYTYKIFIFTLAQIKMLCTSFFFNCYCFTSKENNIITSIFDLEFNLKYF